jgi:hypoxanthine phosphoribosyltransferase
MSGNQEEIMVQAMALPPDARAILADRLLHSINSPNREESGRLCEEEAERLVQQIKKYERYDVFLSFSSYDRHIAGEIRDMITSVGLNCFMSCKDLGAGAIWAHKIKEALINSDKILILVTPRSIKSKWILMETGAAWMCGKDLIPIIQFVDPEQLGDIIKDYHTKVVETNAQKESLVNELLELKKRDMKLPFETMISRIRVNIEEMIRKRVFPDLVVGSGSYGTICAGIIAESFGKKPLKVIGCHFSWKGSERKTTIDLSSIQKKDVEDKNVLVVEWARQTGETYHIIEEKLSAFNPAALYSFALFWTKRSDRPPDYVGFEYDQAPIPPWSNLII